MYTPDEYYKIKKDRLKQFKEPKKKYKYYLPEKRCTIYSDSKDIEDLKQKHKVTKIIKL